METYFSEMYSWRFYVSMKNLVYICDGVKWSGNVASGLPFLFRFVPVLNRCFVADCTYWSMVFTGMFFILSFSSVSLMYLSFFLFLWFLLTTSVWMFCVKLNLKSFWVYSFIWSIYQNYNEINNREIYEINNRFRANCISFYSNRSRIPFFCQ